MEEERPRFRRDLDTRPLEVEGVAYVDATDPRSGNVFRFYDFEHAVAEVLDGRALAELLPDARKRTGLFLTAEQLRRFTEKLRELGFLEVGDDDATSAGPAPAGMLDGGSAAPEAHEAHEMDRAMAAAEIPPVSAEPLAAPEEAIFKEPSGEKPPEQEPPSSERPPVEEPPADEPPVKEPVVEEEPDLPPRSGELVEPPRAAARVEPEVLAEAAVVAPDLQTEAVAGLPGSDEPTKTERRDDLISASAEKKDALLKSTLVGVSDPRKGTLVGVPEPLKGTLHGLPFQALEEVAATARAAAEKTPPPLPVRDPFLPAPSRLQVAPFPPSTTPPPQEALAPEPIPVTTAEVIPLNTTAEVEPLEEGGLDLPPQGKSGVVPTLGPSVEAVALRGSSEVPALTVPVPAPTAPRSKPHRIPPMLFAAAGVMAAGAIGFFGYRLSATSEPQGPIAVRTIVPSAGTTYRWFDATGIVKSAGEKTLTFTTGGKVVRVASAGTSFHPGDVIAEVEGAPQFRQVIDHNKQRLAYYEQRLEEMTQDNNRPEMRQAELKIAEKKRLIAEAQAGLSKQGVVATGAGEIAEALVAPGAVVKAGAPAVRVKGTDWRAELELSRDDANAVRRLGFCRVEIGGKPFECSLSAEGGDETHVFLDLPTEPEMAAGKPVRLARARYDAAFVLPAAALAPTKGSDRRVYVVKDGRAESYAVVLSDQSPTEIVVTQGLEPGSVVVAEVPPGLKPRAPVKASPAK